MKALLCSSWRTPHSSPPLGIAYIAAFIKREGFDVEVFDYNFAKSDDEIRDFFGKTNANIIGISSMSPDFPNAQKIARIAKEETGLPVVIGGAHATIMPEEILKDHNFDIAVIGEGEQTFAELLKEMQKGENARLEKVKGIAFRIKSEKVGRTEQRPFIHDLDVLPFPARELLNMKGYLKKKQEFPTLMPTTGLIAIRGCPFQCTYCQPTTRMMFGIKARARSPKNVVDEMEMLCEKYKLGSVKIGGDTLTANKKWVFELCDEIEKRGIKTPWIAGTRTNTVNKEVLQRMSKAGCYFIQFGVESGSPRILKEIMNKGATVEQAIKAFDECRKAGILAGANIMFGSPTETRRDVEMTFNLIRKLKPDIVSGYITNPLSGTFLYDYAVENNLITARCVGEIDRHGIGTMKRELTDAEILHYLKKLWFVAKKQKLSYYLMPWKKPHYLRTMSKWYSSLFSMDKKEFLVEMRNSVLAMPVLLRDSIKLSSFEKGLGKS